MNAVEENKNENEKRTSHLSTSTSNSNSNNSGNSSTTHVTGERVRNALGSSVRILKHRQVSDDSQISDADTLDSRGTGLDSLIGKDRKVIYVNVLVVDSGGVVDQRLEERKYMPRPVKQAASFVAKRIVTPEKAAKILCDRMPKVLKERVAARGLNIVVALVFHEGPYVVFELQVKSVDLNKMIRLARQVENGNESLDSESAPESPSLNRHPTIKLVLDILGFLGALLLGVLELMCFLVGFDPQHILEHNYLPAVLQRRMESVMDELIAEELSDRGLNAISAVLPQEKEARFFFDNIFLVRKCSEQEMDIRQGTRRILQRFHRLRGESFSSR